MNAKPSKGVVFMYVQRNLEIIDLETISSFPQSQEELFYVSPRFDYPLTPDQILNLVKDRFEPTVVIHKESNEVVAYANLYKDEEGSFFLGNVIVSPQFRGKGASQYLIHAMIDKAKNSLKAERLKLACHITNTRGLAFYPKQGFKPFDLKISTLEDKRVITIHMSKEII